MLLIIQVLLAVVVLARHGSDLLIPLILAFIATVAAGFFAGAVLGSVGLVVWLDIFLAAALLYVGLQPKGTYSD